jgi:hypothetical protein
LRAIGRVILRRLFFVKAKRYLQKLNRLPTLYHW